MQKSSLLTRIVLGVCLVVGTTTAYGQPARTPSVNVNEVLTDDVVTRVLGFEKDELDAANADHKTKRQLIAEGVAAFQRGNGDEAIAKFEKARNDVDKALPPAEVLMARLCFAVNDQNFVRLGLNFLNKAADSYPEAPEAFMMLANLALLEGRLTDADVLFEKAGQLVEAQAGVGIMTPAKLDTYRKNVYAGRVSVCEQRQNWAKGLDEVRKWLSVEKDDPVALFRQGRLQFMADQDKKDDSAARQMLQDAYSSALVKLSEDKNKDANALPAVPPVELALLELHTANGNIDKARAEIQRIDDKSAEWEANKTEGARVYSTVAQWYLGQGEFNNAKNYAEKAKSLDAESQALKQLQAVIAYFNKDPNAEAQFTEMNQAQPDDFFAANFLALVLADAKTSEGKADDVKRAKAVRIAEMNARLNPKSPVALATLGWAYFNANRQMEAARLFGALEQEQNLQVSPDTAYYMARTFASLNNQQFPNALGRAKSLLELAYNSTGMFRYRKEAEKWLSDLNGGELPPKQNPSASNSTDNSIPVAPSGATPGKNDKPAVPPNNNGNNN